MPEPTSSTPPGATDDTLVPGSSDGSAGGSGPDASPAGGTGSAPVAVGAGGLGLQTAARDSDWLQADLTVALDVSQLWVVPAAVIGGPGLVVLLWIAAQAVAGGIWLPAARRLRGDDARRRST